MRILYIDYMSPSGHEVFNTIQLKSLISIGCKIHLVVYGQFLSGRLEDKNISITRIPDLYSTKNKSSILIRINDFKRLLWIKKNVINNNYDYVIFSSYDILSLYYFKFNIPNIFLINHNNVDQFDSRVKLYLTRHLPNHYIHIALNEYMESKLKESLPGKSVQYVPHGFLETTEKQLRPSFVKENCKFVFCPVNRNYDAELVKELLYSHTLNEYLKENEITIYVKSQLLSVPSDNIQVVGMLSDEEYNYMLTKAIAVLLPYGEEFRYRCSGILFECVARNTPIIATEREALKIYQDKINIHFFKNSKSFVDVLSEVSKSEKKTYNTELLQPTEYWKKVL